MELITMLFDKLIAQPKYALYLFVLLLVPRVWCFFGLHKWYESGRGKHSGDGIAWRYLNCKRCSKQKTESWFS